MRFGEFIVTVKMHNDLHAKKTEEIYRNFNEPGENSFPLLFVPFTWIKISSLKKYLLFR